MPEESWSERAAVLTPETTEERILSTTDMRRAADLAFAISLAAGCGVQEPVTPPLEECVIEVDDLWTTPSISRLTIVFDHADQTLALRIDSRLAEKRWLELYRLAPSPQYRPIRVEQFWDETLTSRVRYYYDAAGSVIRLEVEDAAGAGYAYEYTNTYDSKGQLILREGVSPESTLRIRNTYDVQGHLVQKDVDWGRDGTVDETYRYAYDARGLLSGREAGSAADPVASRWFFRRDDSGRLVIGELDGAGWSRPDGRIDIRMTWTYDGSGSVVRFEQDGTEVLDSPHTDGIADTTRRYSGGCGAVGEKAPDIYSFADEEPWYRR